ncbi:MAG: fibronectin type III domain-containing protein [Nitrospinota bacterium]
MLDKYPSNETWQNLGTGTGGSKLVQAGAKWANLYIGWQYLQTIPTSSCESEDNWNDIDLHWKAWWNYLLEQAIEDLKSNNYRISLIIKPAWTGGWDEDNIDYPAEQNTTAGVEWRYAIRTADPDALCAFRKTMYSLAERFYDKIDAWQIDQEPNDALGGSYGGVYPACRDSNGLPIDPANSNCDERCEKVAGTFISGFIWDVCVRKDDRLYIYRCDNVSCIQTRCEDYGGSYVTNEELLQKDFSLCYVAGDNQFNAFYLCETSGCDPGIFRKHCESMNGKIYEKSEFLEMNFCVADCSDAFAETFRAGVLGIKDFYESIGRSDGFVYWGSLGWEREVYQYLSDKYQTIFSDGISPHLFWSQAPDQDYKFFQYDTPDSKTYRGTIIDAIRLAYLTGRDYGISYNMDGKDTVPIGMVQQPYSTCISNTEPNLPCILTLDADRDRDYPLPGDALGLLGISEEDQANYRVRSSVLQLTLDYIWSGWQEHMQDWSEGSTPDPWSNYWGHAGILREDGSEKPAYFALMTLKDKLKRATFLRRIPLSDNSQHAYSFLKDDNTMVTVMWDADDSSVVGFSTEGGVNVFKRDGEAGECPGKECIESFTLEQSPKYVVGTVRGPLGSDYYTNIRKISNSGLPAIHGIKDSYIIDFHNQKAAMDGGTLKINLPPGWTPPNTEDSRQGGYTTVEPGHHVEYSDVTITDNGDNTYSIIIHFQKMPIGGSIHIYYGDVRPHAVLLDTGFNGILDRSAVHPRYLAPPDNSYHKVSSSVSYSEYLGYGFNLTNWDIPIYSKRSELNPHESIFADRSYLTTDLSNSDILELKAKVKPSFSTFIVKVYLNSPDPTTDDDYMEEQPISIPPIYGNDNKGLLENGVSIFDAVEPENDIISVKISPQKEFWSIHDSWRYTRSVYGIDIWPSELGAGPEANASIGINNFEIRARPLKGNWELVSSLPLEVIIGWPIISNVRVANITENSTTINWDTNEEADSCVNIVDKDPICDGGLVTSHSISLTGLSPDTTYSILVSSTDASGNSTSVGYNFTTLPKSDITPPDEGGGGCFINHSTE